MPAASTGFMMREMAHTHTSSQQKRAHVMDTTSLAPNSIIKAADELVVADLAGEAVILNMRNGVYYSLDNVGALVWSLLQQPATIASLCAAVVRQYDVAPAQCEQDLYQLIAQLAAEQLIEVDHAQDSAQVAAHCV